MKKVAARISFAGSQLGEARHVCAFFNSDDEEYRVLLPGQTKDYVRRTTRQYPLRTSTPGIATEGNETMTLHKSTAAQAIKRRRQ